MTIGSPITAPKQWQVPQKWWFCFTTIKLGWKGPCHHKIAYIMSLSPQPTYSGSSLGTSPFYNHCSPHHSPKTFDRYPQKDWVLLCYYQIRKTNCKSNVFVTQPTLSGSSLGSSPIHDHWVLHHSPKIMTGTPKMMIFLCHHYIGWKGDIPSYNFIRIVFVISTFLVWV